MGTLDTDFRRYGTDSEYSLWLRIMVKEVKQSGQTLYICEQCGFAYKEKRWAEKCQQWCEQHQTCNLEIIQHALPTEE